MKLPFFLESKINKIIKPQLTTVIEYFINGKRIKKFFGKSVNANFLQLIYINFCVGDTNFVVSPAGNNTRTDVQRDDGTWVATSSMQLSTGVVGIDFRGIVVSSSTLTLLPNIYNVPNIIRHGTGAGQMIYSLQNSIKGATISGSVTEFILNRTFQNLSGGSISVNSIGVYQGGSTFVARDYVLLYADNGSVTVLNTETLTVQITFSVTT